MTSPQCKRKRFPDPVRCERSREQAPKGNSGGSPLKCKWRDFGCKEAFVDNEDGRNQRANHQKSGSKFRSIDELRANSFD